MMESHPVRTASCLSDVLDGIAVSAKTPASLRKALPLRTVELSLGRAPRERARERIVEQVVVPLKEVIAEVLQFTPLERDPERIAKQMLDIRVPWGMEEILAVVQEVVVFAPTGRVQQRTVEHATVPEFPEQTVEVVPAPTERVHQRTVEQVPVPQILAETVEVALVPRERVRHGIVDVPVPQVLEETVEVGRLDPHEQTVDRRANCGCTSFSGRDRSGGEVVLYKNKCSGSTPIPQFVVLLVHTGTRAVDATSKLWRCFRSAIENESQRRQ